MKTRVLLPFMLVVLFLAACAPSPELRNEAYLDDTSLITGEACAAPCWRELIPGETAWGLAQDTISNAADLSVTNTGRDRSTGEAWIEFATQDGTFCCRVYTNNGETLSQILLLLSPQITVGEVFTVHGEPLYITARAETSDQAYVALIYPETPMVLYAFAETVDTSSITADSEIVGLSYLTSEDLQTLLETTTVYAWTGYGLLGDIFIEDNLLAPQAPTEE